MTRHSNQDFPGGRGCGEPPLQLAVYFPSSLDAPKRTPTAESPPQIAGTSWNRQWDRKRGKITAAEATEAPLSKAALSGGPGVRGGREGASRDMTYISLHLNQLWVQLGALEFQWCLRGWSKWWYKRISCTKNTMGRWTKAGGWTNCSGACRNILCLRLSLEVYVILMSVNRLRPSADTDHVTVRRSRDAC